METSPPLIHQFIFLSHPVLSLRIFLTRANTNQPSAPGNRNEAGQTPIQLKKKNKEANAEGQEVLGPSLVAVKFSVLKCTWSMSSFPNFSQKGHGRGPDGTPCGRNVNGSSANKCNHSGNSLEYLCILYFSPSK